MQDILCFYAPCWLAGGAGPSTPRPVFTATVFGGIAMGMTGFGWLFEFASLAVRTESIAGSCLN